MISVVTRSTLFYRRREIWFYDGGPYPHDSNTIFYQAFALPNGKSDGAEEFVTTCLDLTRSPDDLLSHVNRTTRYHIRKGGKLGVETQVFDHPTAEQIMRFVEGHRADSRKRGLGGIEPERVKRLVGAGAFTITHALLDGRVLATHGYVHDETRARLLVSYGADDLADEALRGYANKLLHWEDILAFRDSGRSVYDFGGIDLEGTPGIARFKLSFGGSPETSRNVVVWSGLYGSLRRWQERRTS